ncbi:MAG: hypothetical protein HOP28_10980, partial [Gemmatimonadales bacterium]|nr:hypothetical protein [Gemmatimonadales bacterium]
AGGYLDANGPDETEDCEFRIVSGMEQGADRLIVRAAPNGWRLQAILPMESEGFKATFDPHLDEAEGPGGPESFDGLLARAESQAGVVVLDRLPGASSRFEHQGRMICLNSDVLVAVWDGQQSKSSGGTGSNVALAVRLGIPVVRVATDGQGGPWLQGPGDSDARDGEGLQHLEARLERLMLAPPPASEPGGSHHRWPDLREAYFAERAPVGRKGQLYDQMYYLLSFDYAGAIKNRKRILSGLRNPYGRHRITDPAEATRKRWRENWTKEVGLDSSFVESILGTRLAQHYGWASTLANYYAGRYRSTFLWAYLLAAVSVTFAAVGFSRLLLGQQEDAWTSLAYAGGEFLLLAAVFGAVIWARRQKFHEKWLDFRALTEGLRSLTFTLPLGVPSVLAAGRGAVVETWVDWMHRAVVREIGALPVTMTRAHLREARDLISRGVLDGQIRYHGHNARALRRAARRLEVFTTWCFLGGLALAAYHTGDALFELFAHHRTMWEVFFGRKLYELPTAVTLGIIAISVPAFAAAIHGFLSQAGMQDGAIRSRNIHRQLGEIQKTVGDPSLSLDSATLGSLATETAATMNAELGAWFTSYQGKPPNLP